MGLIALFIGIILIVSAVRNSQGALFGALEQDVPKFVVWGAAIIAVGAIGVIPGLKPVSRWLLALVIVVIVVNNYQKLVKGFQNAWQNSPQNDNQPATTSSGTSSNSAATGAASLTPNGAPSTGSSFLDGLLESIPGVKSFENVRQ